MDASLETSVVAEAVTHYQVYRVQHGNAAKIKGTFGPGATRGWLFKLI